MRRHLRIENVLSTLALFAVVAGGTAAALPGKKTVQANDLRKNSVKAAAVAKNAVRAAEIKAGAVRSAEIKDGAVVGADVADQGLGYEDLGSNSVVARIRSTGGPIQTDDGGEMNPVEVPLAGNQWTQAANEIEVFFGEVTFTQPQTCDGVFPDLVVEIFIDGERIDRMFLDANPGQTMTLPAIEDRFFFFEPGSPTPRSATVQIHDTCTGAGQNYTLNEIAVNAVAIR